MGWSGHVIFGDTYVAYFGAPDQNDLHAHAVYQIVLSADQLATIVDENGTRYTGSALLIRPLVSHSIIGDAPVTLIYLDPKSAVALQISKSADTADIAQISQMTLPFQVFDSPDQIVIKLKSLTANISDHMDTRLVAALDRLSAEPGNVSIADTAKLCGISPSRLRTLAREQFGVPLSTWLLWRKLERAARELATGESVAKAALVGGFSDQAHFTRCMRRMFGVTPSATLESLSSTETSSET